MCEDSFYAILRQVINLDNLDGFDFLIALRVDIVLVQSKTAHSVIE